MLIFLYVLDNDHQVSVQESPAQSETVPVQESAFVQNKCDTEAVSKKTKLYSGTETEQNNNHIM